MLFGLGYVDIGLVLFQPAGLLILNQCGTPLAAYEHVVLGLSGLVVGLGIVILLASYSLLPIQLLVAMIVGLSLFEPDAQLLDIGVGDRQVVGRGRDNIR